MDFSTPPLPMTHIMPNGTSILNAGGGTLRRGMRAMVPPPDVTHHTNHSKSTHDLHNSINQNVSQQTLNNHSNKPMSSQLPPTNSNKQPPGILKDPNRKQQQQQQQHHQHANMQILNVQNAPGIGNSLLLGIGGSNVGPAIGVGTYDPNTHNLSSFNASMGYTDADGHLV